MPTGSKTSRVIKPGKRLRCRRLDHRADEDPAVDRVAILGAWPKQRVAVEDLQRLVEIRAVGLNREAPLHSLTSFCCLALHAQPVFIDLIKGPNRPMALL